MKESKLLNKGKFYGEFLCKKIEEETNITETLLTDGIIIQKEANKDIWVGSNSYLQYTVTITNNTLVTIKYVTFEDQLDTQLIDLVFNSVFLNGQQTSYEYIDGLLKVNIGEVPHGNTIITFQVKRI